MTGEDIETELRLLNVGWDPTNGGIVHEDTPTLTCNAVSCGSYATIANDAQVTAADMALALRAMIDGERDLFDAITSAASEARSQQA